MEHVFGFRSRLAGPRVFAAFAAAVGVMAALPSPAAARTDEDLQAKIARILGKEIPAAKPAAPASVPVAGNRPKASVSISETKPPEHPGPQEPPRSDEPQAQQEPPPPPPPSLKEALALREAGGPENLAMAAKTLQTLALGGDAAAQYALARACERGEGLKAPSPRQAVFWADRAASAGCADAHVLLGLYWTVGFGVDRDEGAARRAFAAAAAAGDPVGATLLAVTGAAGDSEKALAAGARLSDFAPFAGLVERAGLSGAVLAASVPGRPPVFRTRPDCPENASNPDSPCLSE